MAPFVIVLMSLVVLIILIAMLICISILTLVIVPISPLGIICAYLQDEVKWFKKSNHQELREVLRGKDD